MGGAGRASIPVSADRLVCGVRSEVALTEQALTSSGWAAVKQ